MSLGETLGAIVGGFVGGGAGVTAGVVAATLFSIPGIGRCARQDHRGRGQHQALAGGCQPVGEGQQKDPN